MTISGTLIKNSREEIGLSQAKLSELASVPQHLLSAYELGKSLLNEDNLFALQKVLNEISHTQIREIKKKRYQVHSFNRISDKTSRESEITPTDENIKYLTLINNLEESKKDSHKTGKVISLFSGCGGFSLGFSWANFEILGFLELKNAFRKTYRQNFSQPVELGADIQTVNDETILGWNENFGEIDVVIGGPPCQGFSLSGKRNAEDPRNNLFKSYLKIVRGLQPKIAVMENVRLLTSMKTADGESVLKHIYKDFDASGYRVKHFEINAKNYGVPQHRERVIFIAVRNDLKNIEPTMPPPTHGETRNLFSPVNPYRTFADACSDLEFLESGEKSAIDSFHEAVKHPDHVIEWLWNVQQGKSAHENEDLTLRPPSGYNTTYKRQIWNEPASTVQTTFGMISGCRNVHPIATRSLTVREAARIQSFPDNFKFSGSLGDIRATIGNALPPLLAFALAEHIKTELLNFVEVSGF
jgi:DNA (cytosine-5)-methyltransferase 1